MLGYTYNSIYEFSSVSPRYEKVGKMGILGMRLLYGDGHEKGL